ncbi:MAG TPA: GFA family protein [Burkholderiaceae bacterium]|nr:GFA family protein [Burkholderiaceae bacterium]
MANTHATNEAWLTGRCLCGAVQLQVSHERPAIGACHCSICRKWSGGPFLSMECHETPVIRGEEHVGVYDSSDWAQRGFCKQCGTHLFYRLKEGGFYALSAGLFKESGNWPFTLEVFVDEQPGNYAFSNETKRMTGAEVFEQWTPKQDE